jgi:signal peptidase I
MGLAAIGLFVVLVAAMYFFNPFHSPLKDPRARVLGYATYAMPGPSMEPAIKQGAVFAVNTAVLRDRDPRPGEIVVFLFPPSPGEQYVKRVVAVGGSTVEMRNGDLFVDDKRVPEPYLGSRPVRDTELPPFEVPAGTFFVLGDNRDDSMDSRAFGPVPRDHIVGVFNGLAVNN